MEFGERGVLRLAYSALMYLPRSGQVALGQAIFLPSPTSVADLYVSKLLLLPKEMSH